MGVEGAHKSELTAEAGTRKLTRYAKRRWREHPARKVAKWERKDIKARVNVDFQKMAAEHPELASNPLSRIQQKWKLKRPVFQRGKGGGKAERKGRKESRCRFGECDPAGGAVCDPSSCGGFGFDAVAADLLSPVGGKLHLSHAWQRSCQCGVRHFLCFGGRRPAWRGRGTTRRWKMNWRRR